MQGQMYSQMYRLSKYVIRHRFKYVFKLLVLIFCFMLDCDHVFNFVITELLRSWEETTAQENQVRNSWNKFLSLTLGGLHISRLDRESENFYSN